MSRINLFEHIKDHEQIEDFIDDDITDLNSDEGFTIIGWCKCGELNNHSSEENVDAGESCFHIVSNFLTNTNVTFDNLKFNVRKV